MPIYEYDCPDCGVVEVMQKITADALCECPYCLEKGKHNKVKRRISLNSFRLVGTGWYKTDYPSNGSSGSNGNGTSTKHKNASEPKKSEGKTEKKAKKASTTASAAA